VSFINADDAFRPASRAFVEKGEQVPFEMPMILGGVDTTEMARRIHEMGRAHMSGDPVPPLDRAKLDEELKRRP
jgi:hypothetical protein